MKKKQMNKLSQQSSSKLIESGVEEYADAPFLILNNKQDYEKFLTKQRKMANSISSKYLAYNT
jgi:hypothetical protein